MKTYFMFILICYLSITIAYADNLNLPPDPGEAGKQTLAGIDSDNDGVRDDIQRWIALTYPDSARTRALLTQKAKLLQKFLLNADNKEVVIATFYESMKTSHCSEYIYVKYKRSEGRGSEFDRSTQLLEGYYMNTDLRIRAYLGLERHWTNPPIDMDYGSSDDNRDDYKNHCDFDPDALPN